MPEGLYLGKIFDPASEQLGEEFRLDAEDLTTHGIVIGMTGSGKTGLSVVLIEEILNQDIPVIAIDPKGDMANLALAFGGLTAGEFKPWIDPASAAADVDDSAAAAAKLWSQGLADWGIGPGDVARYAANRSVRVITPGSFSGVPLNLIEQLEPPGKEVADDEEEFRDQIDGVVTALLGLVGIAADAVESREYIYLFTLIERAWRAGDSYSLETLIGHIANPPIDKLGALPLDAVYPPAERSRLMLAINGLLASPPMEAWRQGEPVDIDAWLRTNDGRPTATIVYTAHLEEELRVFVTALILNKIVSWVRQQPGTGQLRCLLYMDEIFGYFPPTANPPTKKPLLTLLKQARAHGLGVLLSTQNPVDLDYRGLANMGFWAIGRLQTTQDQERIRTGIEAALADSPLGKDFNSLVADVRKRVFLVHDIHRKAPALVHTRWAMSYLRGPITRQEIELLPLEQRSEAKPIGSSIDPTSGNPRGAVEPEAAQYGPPVLPAALQVCFLNRDNGQHAVPHIYVRAAVRYKIGGAATDEASQMLAFRIDGDQAPMETLESDMISIEESQLSESPPVGVTYQEIPAYLSVDGQKALERALRERLDDRLAVDVLYDAETKLLSRPSESAQEFALRVQDAPSVQNARRRLQTKIEQKRAALAASEAELSDESAERWASIGTTILDNIGILSGKRRSIRGVGSILSRQRAGSKTRAKAEQLRAEIAALESELGEIALVDLSRFERRSVKPARGDVSIIKYGILWIY